MKTTKIILAIGALLCSFNLLQAQVKIGDNPLDIGANRLLEIENENLGAGGEYLIVTDSLRFGRTISNTAFSPNSDALMMKLYGYGFGNFSTSNGSPYTQDTELISGVTANVFMGITNDGELLEVPLALTLTTTSTTAELSFDNGTDVFGTVDLNPLDSIFATDTDVLTLISESAGMDGDTITGNEWIDDIQLSSLDPNSDGPETYRLLFTENTTAIGPKNNTEINLGLIFATDIQVADTITNVRNELADTAATLRGLTFYKTDGTFTGDRVADGDAGAYDLTFTDLDSFNIEGTTTINSTSSGNINTTTSGGNIGTTAATGNISTTATLGDINNTATAGDINLDASAGAVSVSGILNADNTVNFTDYDTRIPSGNENNLLGVSATGEVVTVSLDSIGGDASLSSPVDLDEDGTEETTVDEAIQASNREIDSTIYIYDGILSSDRVMNMNSNTLTFAGSDTVLISDDGRVAIGRSTFTPNTATSNVMLEVAGDVYATQVFSSSDRRFKKNIRTVNGALDKVLAMEGVTYDFRTDEFPNRNFTTTHQLGFIAQDVEKIVPEVVLTNGDGYKAVDYSKLTALLNEAIKEQQTQLDAQAEIIKTQQTMLASIMTQNATLSQEMADIKSQLNNVSTSNMSEE